MFAVQVDLRFRSMKAEVRWTNDRHPKIGSAEFIYLFFVMVGIPGDSRQAASIWCPGHVEGYGVLYVMHVGTVC